MFFNQKASARSCQSPSVRATADSELRKRHKQTSSPTLRQTHRDTSRFSDLRTGALSLNLKLIRAHTPHTHTAILQKHDSISTILLKDKYQPSRQERTMREMHDGSVFHNISFSIKKKKTCISQSSSFWAFPRIPPFPNLSFSKRTSNYCNILCVTLALVACDIFFIFAQTKPSHIHTHTHNLFSKALQVTGSAKTEFFSSWMLGNLKDLTCKATTIAWAWICTHWRLSHRKRWKWDLLSL